MDFLINFYFNLDDSFWFKDRFELVLSFSFSFGDFCVEFSCPILINFQMFCLKVLITNCDLQIQQIYV